jgi:hypothetical protein
MDEEVFQQLRVFRPRWSKPVDRDRKASYLAEFKDGWRNLRNDPSWLPPRTTAVDIHDLIRLVRASQRRLKDVVRQKVPFGFRESDLDRRLAPVVSARSHEENFWRWQGCVATWKSLTNEGVHPDGAEWWRLHVDASRITQVDWAEFWVAEAQAHAMKRTRAVGLAEYLQVRGSIGSGNMGDIAQVPHIFDADVFFTSDKRFYHILELLRSTYYPDAALPYLLVKPAERLEETLSAAAAIVRQRLA